MKRYRFLLLAFFLANNIHAEGLVSGMNPSMNGAPKLVNVNSIPDTRTINSGAARATDIRRISPRNTAEVGSTVEPVVSGSRTSDARSAQATGTTKTSSKGMSCKTYEGKTYDQGEAGYSDCMRNIRTDRQGTRTVP